MRENPLASPASSVRSTERRQKEESTRRIALVLAFRPDIIRKYAICEELKETGEGMSDNPGSGEGPRKVRPRLSQEE